MPRTAAGEPWEQAIRSSVRSKDGFTVSNSRGRPLLRYRPSDGKPESCVLPVDWSKAETERILLLVNRIAKLRLSGDQGTLKSALQATQDQSTTMRRETDWRAIRDDFRNRLMKGATRSRKRPGGTTIHLHRGSYLAHRSREGNRWIFTAARNVAAMGGQGRVSKRPLR